ncbi:MAG: VanW family protein [Peptoanaerobacter stomatis]|uniref:VanW family protein n=1 Tax=Peptoanaerobacter stomatis TaxID=796937 RepID=UPI003F9F237E
MKERKKVKKRSVFPKIAIVFAVVLMIFSGVVVYANTLMNTGNIYNNVFINGVNVSNLSVNEAKSLLENNFKFGTLTLTNEDKQWVQGLSDVGFSYDIDTAVEKAYEIGRKGNFLTNAIKVITLNSGLEEFIELETKEDYTKLDEFYNKVASEVNTNPINATVSADGGSVSIIPSQNGYVVDIEKLKADVENAVKSSEEKTVKVAIPVAVKEPSVKTEELSSINGIIASYTSKYSTKDSERSFNVALAAQKLNGQLLMPGEEVSFLGVLGDVATSNGFRAAKIIVNNEYQDGVGGGVCQVSSTLYNALLLGGMDITQRTNHSFPIGYVPIGRDATVATSGPDLKYKNSYPFPVYIKTYADSGVMVAQIYGDTTRSKHVDIYSEVTSTVEPTLVYKNDPNLPKGKEEIEDPGHTGYTSVTYKMVDGQKTVISRDRYTMTPKIIRTGTGPEEVKPAEDAAKTTTVNNVNTQQNSNETQEEPSIF